jgi:hypothetical protein
MWKGMYDLLASVSKYAWAMSCFSKVSFSKLRPDSFPKMIPVINLPRYLSDNMAPRFIISKWDSYQAGCSSSLPQSQSLHYKAQQQWIQAIQMKAK